jgi:hypothetical protein
MKTFSLLTLAIAAFAVPAFAQSEPRESVDIDTVAEDAPQVRYQSVTEIDGEALKLTGVVKGPGEAYVALRRSTQFRPLVTLRTEFDLEMQDSANAMR